jgi:hypothetical protein
VLRGRVRRRLLAGLVLLVAAGGHSIWAAQHLAVRNSDERAFDQVLVSAARSVTALPAPVRALAPQSGRELYLKAVLTDQQDLMFGMALFMLRMIVTVTVAFLGMVLVTAASTEWEIRSTSNPNP